MDHLVQEIADMVVGQLLGAEQLEEVALHERLNEVEILKWERKKYLHGTPAFFVLFSFFPRLDNETITLRNPLSLSEIELTFVSPFSTLRANKNVLHKGKGKVDMQQLVFLCFH